MWAENSRWAIVSSGDTTAITSVYAPSANATTRARLTTAPRPARRQTTATPRT
jgi:hypothetical protein